MPQLIKTNSNRSFRLESFHIAKFLFTPEDKITKIDVKL